MRFFSQNKKINIDISDIIGTNCYLDDSAKPDVEHATNNCELKATHFLGSGNYHYLTYFFLKRIDREFDLVLFDNHTDIKPPAFGDIISCGSWVYYALKEIKNLKRVYLIGMSKEHIEETKAEFTDSCILIDDTKFLPKELPIYISIDTDVLSEKYIKTAWDQGEMSPQHLVEQLNYLDSHDILGIDVCGCESLSAFFECCSFS